MRTSITRASAWPSWAALLEAQGFRVGIIAQPDWQSAEPFKQLGRPNLFFGITAGNMDSMVNRYTVGQAHPQRRRVHAGRRGRQAAGSQRDRVRAARARGVQGRAHRHRRHRGLAAPHRALRLLEREGAPLGPARRQGRPAGVRQRRAADLSRSRIAWRPARSISEITDLRGTAFVRKSTPMTSSRSTPLTSIRPGS